MVEFFGGLALGLIVGVSGCLALVGVALHTYEKVVSKCNTDYANRMEAVVRQFEYAGRVCRQRYK